MVNNSIHTDTKQTLILLLARKTPQGSIQALLNLALLFLAQFTIEMKSYVLSLMLQERVMNQVHFFWSCHIKKEFACQLKAILPLKEPSQTECLLL